MLSNKHIESKCFSGLSISKVLETIYHTHLKDKTIGDFSSIIFNINSTNGYLSVMPYNAKENIKKEADIFMLALPRLFSNSLRHIDGSFHFDQVCQNALFEFTEFYFYQHDKPFGIYFYTDLNPEPEEKII